MKPMHAWKVLPHGPLIALEPEILTVVGEIHMPLVEFPRRMTVVRLRDGRLVIYNAIALDEASMARLEAFGELAYLIVPNDHHRLDAAVFKQRYPSLQVITPGGSAERVAEIVPVDTSTPRFGDNNVHFQTVAGTENREAALLARTDAGTTLVLNDLIGNLANVRGMGGWMLKLMGFAGAEPQIPHPAKFVLIKDKQALKEQFEIWAQLPDLRRILVSHGEPIEGSPTRTLLDLAASLK